MAGSTERKGVSLPGGHLWPGKPWIASCIAGMVVSDKAWKEITMHVFKTELLKSSSRCSVPFTHHFRDGRKAELLAAAGMPRTESAA